MTPTLTTDVLPIMLEWSTGTGNVSVASHPASANVEPIKLGGIWKGQTITDEDMQQGRKELWGKLEADED